MGAEVRGRYRLEYIIEDITQKLARNERALTAHEQRLGGGLMTVKPEQMDAASRYLNAHTKKMRESRLAYAQHQKQAKESSRALDSHTDSVSKATEQYRYWGLAMRRMMLWWGSAALMIGAQRVVRSTLEIAGAFQYLVAELRVIGQEGEESYKRLAASGYDAAIMTGRSFNEAADAMRAWIRQGYSAAEVAELTKSTLIGLNLTEMSSIELVRTMTAVMQAYNIPATASLSIIDRLIGVSRKFAIETGQLAVGLRRFASSAEMANMTLNQQMGIMTAMMVSTQQNAQMVGRAGRTITTRMRRNAVDALETIAKVDVYTDKTRQTYRSLWDILTDLASTWERLSEVEQEEIAFQAAGLRQREFFLALMRDFDIAQKANIEALASAGLAYKSNIILVNTYQKAVAALRTEWERVLSIQSGVLDFFTNIVQGLRMMLRDMAALPEAVAAVGTALAGLGGIGLTAIGHPLVGVPMAIGGLLGSAAYLMGKFRLPDLRDIIEQHKMLIETQYQTALSTEGLAKEYIKLHKAQDKGRDNTEQLKLARDRINDLNPLLLQGEQNLVKVYDILAGKLDSLSESTRAAYKARHEWLVQEKEFRIAEAQRRLFTAKQALPLELRGTSTKELADIGRARMKEYGILIKEAVAQNKELTEQLSQGAEKTWSQVEAARYLGMGVRDVRNITQQSVDSIIKAADNTYKEAMQLQGVVQAYEEIALLQKELDMLKLEPIEPKKTDVIEKQRLDMEEVSRQAKILTEQLEIQLVAWERAYIQEHGLVDAEHERVRMAVHLYAQTIKYLTAESQATDDINKRKAIMDELAKYGDKTLNAERLKLKIVQGILKLRNLSLQAVKRRTEEEDKAHQQSMKQIEEAKRLQLRGFQESGRQIDALMSLRTRAAEAEREQLERIEAERIKLTQGTVAAAQYEYDQAKRRFEFLQEQDQTEEVRAMTQEAYLAMLDRETALHLASMASRQRAADIAKDMTEAQFQAEVSMVRMREGEIAAAEMLVQKHTDELALLVTATQTDDIRLRTAEKRAQVQEAENRLDSARMAQRLKLEDEYTNAKEKERQSEAELRYQLIEQEKGRVAALKEEMDDMSRQLDMAMVMASSEQEQLNIIRLRIALRQKEGEYIEAISQEQEAALQKQIQIISQIGQLIAGEIREQTMGQRITGIAGLAASFASGHPTVAAGIVALGNIFAAVADREEENTKSLDMNTLALDRNTEMLTDIREAVIGGIAGRFVWPATVEHYGFPSLQGGGRVVSAGMAYVHPGEVRQQGPSHLSITISGAGQNADQIVSRVMYEVNKRYGTDKDRGYSSQAYGMPR